MPSHSDARRTGGHTNTVITPEKAGVADGSDVDGYSFNRQPPKAVTDYLSSKSLKPAFDWQDVWRDEHAFAFTVAKATDINVLTDIFEELQKAQAEGLPFSQFQKDLEPRLMARGWWGVKDVIDPDTGETVRARLGSPRRLRTIYWANVRTARAAGQWERIQRTKQGLPFLLYQLGPSKEHRPHHEDKNGLMAPVDDPVWKVWFTPNGWGCKCWLRQISRSEAERRGWPGNRMPAAVPEKQFVNKRTGEVTKVPQGIDPGWDSNPGLAREKNARRFLAGALDQAPLDLARIAVKDLLRDSEFRAHIRGERLSVYPIAVLPSDLADLLGSKTRTVLLSQDTAKRHNAFVDNPGKYPPAELWTWIQENIETAEVYRDPAKPQVLQFKFYKDGKAHKFVIKATADRLELYLTTFFNMGGSRVKKMKGERVK